MESAENRSVETACAWGAGNFPQPPGKIPRSWRRGPVDSHATAMVSVLLISRPSDHVFKAAILAIVLTSGVGFNATLLCDVWCHPSLAAGSCHVGSTSNTPSVADDQSCGHSFAAVALHEQFLRDAPAPDVERTIPSLVAVISDSLIYSDGHAHPWAEPPLVLRPPTSILRI